MDETAVANALAACEQELQAGRTPDLRALGFWRAVAAVKRHPELVDRYATRIATIDRAAFRRRVRLAFPVTLGVILLDLGLFGGLLLLGIATFVDHPWREIIVLVAAGAIATKLTPFLVIPYALAIGTDMWAVLALVGLGVVQILTDVLYSVRASDWKKFRREMRLAR